MASIAQSGEVEMARPGSTAGALEQGRDDMDDSANVPTVFKRNARKGCPCRCIAPQTICAFICGILITLLMAAIAKDPIQLMATDYLCESADVGNAGAADVVPVAPELLPANVTAILRAMGGDLKRLVQHIVSGAGRGDAYNRTADFVDKFGHRQSGSESLSDSLVALKEMLQEEGLENVEAFPVENVPRWVRGKEACTLIEPLMGGVERNLEVLGLGFSVGTTADGLKADVLVVESLAELVEMRESVDGKIVLFDMPYLGYGYERSFPFLITRLGSSTFTLVLQYLSTCCSQHFSHPSMSKRQGYVSFLRAIGHGTITKAHDC